MATMERVLVTGGTGFVGAHCILALLERGYRVRTTMRSLRRAEDVRAMLRVGGASEEVIAGVEFAEADLLSDAGWSTACEGCTFVLHVASPFPPALPKHEDELIIPAREGTLRVLRAARDASVRRVVVTSSFAAIGYGHADTNRTFTEEDWTDPNGADVYPYIKSKVLAERAAWEFVRREGLGMELAVVNPVGIFGPALGPDYATSIAIVQRMLDGEMPGVPRMNFGGVDVRDVAELHLLAMTRPEAAGERFLATADGSMWMVDLARMLHERLGALAKKVPTRELPNIFIRLYALVDPMARQIVTSLGKVRLASSAKAQRVLGWKPRSFPDALVASAESLDRLGLLKSKR